MKEKIEGKMNNNLTKTSLDNKIKIIYYFNLNLYILI